jgi:hypothetical protein
MNEVQVSPSISRNLYGLSSDILISPSVFFMMTIQFCPKVMVEMMRRRVWREILSHSFASCFSRFAAVPYLCMYAHVFECMYV